MCICAKSVHVFIIVTGFPLYHSSLSELRATGTSADAIYSTVILIYRKCFVSTAGSTVISTHRYFISLCSSYFLSFGLTYPKCLQLHAHANDPNHSLSIFSKDIFLQSRILWFLNASLLDCFKNRNFTIAYHYAGAICLTIQMYTESKQYVFDLLTYDAYGAQTLLREKKLCIPNV